MKTFLFILITITLVPKIYGQRDIDTLDFLNIQDTLQPGRNLQHNQKVRIMIENINRNIFKVDDSFKEKEFNATPPAAFTGIKLPGFIGGPGIDRSKEVVSRGEKDARGKEVDIIRGYLSSLQQLSQKIDSAVYLNNYFINLANNCNVRFNRVQAVTDSLITDYTGQARNGDSHNGYAATLRHFLNERIQVAIGIGEFITSNQSSFKLPPDVAAAKVAAEKTLDDIKTFAKENKVELLINNYDKLSEPYFTYFTKPIKPKKDEVEVNIDITSEKLDCARQVPINYNQTYRVAGGWKVDFSTGIFFSGGSKTFRDRDLEYVPSSRDTVVIIDKNKNNRVMISLGALAHIYKRSAKCYHFAFSPGLSTTLDISTVNIHLGGSFIWGRENRGVFTVGPVMRQSTVLRKGYELSKPYPRVLLPDAPPTEKRFPVFGWFLSFTYNISKFQKG